MEEAPSEFICSECDRRVKRDSYTYFGRIHAPDESKKCPTCGHIPYSWFYYCSPECYEKGREKHGLPLPLQREKEIEEIMTSEGVDRETAKRIWHKERGFIEVGAGVWKKSIRKPTFHKDFPLLAKKLGFKVYKQGFPDFLIEKKVNMLL